MKKRFRILSLIFSMILLFSCFTGCKKEENKLEKSGYKIISDGVSEYVILLSKDPVSNEYTAAEELQYFMKLATGADMTIVTEDKFEVGSKSAIISIGDTEYADAKNVKTAGTLDRSGYVMKTIDNQLFIRSDGDGLGCVYAVYDLLETSIGYRYYYTDEIYYESKKDVDLYKYDMVVDPDFDFRAMSTWNKFLHSNEDYLMRTRTFRKDDGWAYNGEIHIQCRPDVGVIPNNSEWAKLHRYGTTKTDENGNEIPDHWFSSNGEQLCWTAGEEMYEQAAKDVFARIKSEPTKTIFSVGQADTLTFCACERCEKAKKDWAMNDEGLQIHFINRVASYVNKWVEESFPGREIRLVIFAYYNTEEPPVVEDGKNEWKPYSDKVVLAYDNIDIYFAPIYTDYSKNLTDVENESVYKNLVKWQSYLKGKKNRFLLYTYDTNFHYFFYNFNNFDTFASQVKTYAENGVDYVHSQGANGTNQPCFQEMRYFVESQILWDTSKNYNDLVNEFMERFYKDAAPEIREYYDLTIMRYEQATILDGKQFKTIYANIGDKAIWTENVVDAMDKIFERAYQKIEHYKATDPTTYNKLYNRIKELELTLIYTKLNFYSANYTKSQLVGLVDEFNLYTFKFDINCIKEGGSLTAGLFDYLKN